MERDVCRERESRCVQEQLPYCAAACPVHVDVRGMMTAVSRQDFSAGFLLLARMIPFPRIISRICDRPCQKACRRQEAGGALRINAIEQACVDYADLSNAKAAPTPPTKNQRVAIIGAGLSGLTAAVDLARKGYRATIYEASEKIGGRIWSYQENRLPRPLIEADFLQISALGIEVRLCSMVGRSAAKELPVLCSEYDAVYVGGGLAGMAELQAEADARTRATTQNKIFAGGGQYPYSPINSILHGRISSISIDRYLQQASLTAGLEKTGPVVTKLYTSMKGVEPLKPVIAKEESGYSANEAASEAERCLQCQCLECVKVCEYLGHFGSYPKRYVREIYNNDSIVMGIHHANKMVNSCAACGLCAQVCPQGLDMGEVCLDARRSMVVKGKMPPSVHDFALRDLEFCSGEKFFMAKHQPGYPSSRFLFFPGCQLAASMPQHVEKTYGFLRERLEGGVGLMLGCCGAPAEWAGRQDLFQQVLLNITDEWRKLGKPEVLLACATCSRIFSEKLPELPVRSIWDVFIEKGLPTYASNLPAQSLCIHDPCSARGDRKTQDQTRKLLQRMGMRLEEPELTRQLTTCCSYGGLMSQANPELAQKVVAKRIQASPSDFVVYCAMCRDNFVTEGKPTVHILDLIWADSTAALRPAPDYSMRRENRARLKNDLLRELWGERMEEKFSSFKLEISPSLRKMMQARMILEEDVQLAIQHAETSGEKMVDSDTGHMIAHYRPACVTYWVEYSVHENEFALHNAYSHRMQVVEEAGL